VSGLVCVRAATGVRALQLQATARVCGRTGVGCCCCCCSSWAVLVVAGAIRLSSLSSSLAPSIIQPPSRGLSCSSSSPAAMCFVPSLCE
jgi:hypothetical protein